MDYQSEFDRWCENVSEPVLAAQLAEMRERADAQAIEDAFFQELEFGTGGLRGVLGAGTNRMNIYTVGKATQGIADYIKTHVGVDGTVAICFDSRTIRACSPRRLLAFLRPMASPRISIRAWSPPRRFPSRRVT